MKAIACKIGTRAKWLALAMVCGMALTTSAYAQGFQPPGSPFTPAQQVGTVLTMPIQAWGGFVAQNVIRQNNVSFMHVTQVGGMNLITGSVRQRNTFAPAKKVWCPTGWVDTIKQVNRNDADITQIGVEGGGNVAVLDVQQSNKIAPSGSTWCSVPLWGLGTVLQLNKNASFITQIGDNNVAVVSVSQDNKLKVPTSMVGSLVQINLNLTVINQFGNNNVATVEVHQSNG
jgi:hypothetical protein